MTLGGLGRDGSRAALLLESATAAPDVYVSDLAMTNPRRLTTINPQVADFALGETEVVRWKSDGVEVEGVLLKPVGYQAGKRYPLLVVAHGGPSGAYVNGFRVGGLEGGQVWAGQGWAVFYPNPRGSTNYGEKFLRGEHQRLGRRRLPRHHDRRRRAGRARHRRSGQARAHRLELRRLHDVVGDHADQPLQGGDGRRRPDQHGSMYGTNDIPNVLITYFGGIPNKETHAALHRSLGDDAHRQGDDADADPARRQRRARADRPGL